MTAVYTRLRTTVNVFLFPAVTRFNIALIRAAQCTRETIAVGQTNTRYAHRLVRTEHTLTRLPRRRR